VSAWADISAALESYASAPHEAATELASLNAGYIWMLANCLSSATFVLSMRKRIKLTQFSDFDSTLPSPFPCQSCFQDPPWLVLVLYWGRLWGLADV